MDTDNNNNNYLRASTQHTAVTVLDQLVLHYGGQGAFRAQIPGLVVSYLQCRLAAAAQTIVHRIQNKISLGSAAER